MISSQANLAWLFLPLLANPQPLVRQQACLILLGLYGDRAMTYLRRLIDDADPQIREQARLALLSIAEFTGESIKLQPFRGMYVECMGRLRIYIDSHEMRAQDWVQDGGGRAGWQKVQGVLAYLIHCGRRGTSREALGAAVWSTPPSSSSLARTLNALRQSLGAHSGGAELIERALVLERDFCVLNPEAYHTDAQLFERTYTLAAQHEQDVGLEPAVPLYQHAVRLYTGAYMAEVPRGNSWFRSRRDRLAGDFVLAVERLAEHAFAQRRYEQCIDLCLLALDADATADDIVVWLLRAYASAGRMAEREQVYRRYLHAAGLSADDPAAQQDAVMQEYDRQREAGR